MLHSEGKRREKLKLSLKGIIEENFLSLSKKPEKN